ncbi:MAG: radical SAM protein [Candidatus Paceibacterota bacterium]|jgi:hypothetical protein
MVFVAQYFSIEPLGIHHLVGLVRNVGWECKVVLVRDHDFAPLYDMVREWMPSLVGFQIWTGWHLQTFVATDVVRRMGVRVVIGGPHATYFDRECGTHADWVIKATGFGLLKEILDGTLPPGVHFNKNGRGMSFPLPDRSVTYESYPEFAESPIKSMLASVGCPFTCTYCYAAKFNEMHGGFKFTTRSVADIITEARAIQERWPLNLVYFQDDNFGYKPKWLKEFVRRWKNEIGVPFHAQIRLEFVRGESGERLLDLFAEAGCTGITLAIESGVPFIRDRVLFRHMSEETILNGCRAIMGRGMSLRTEQIMAVPFSNTDTDLMTLDLNNRINPTMAWCSLLAPYGGTDIGTICTNFGFHPSNNDDLEGRSYERSLLHHPAGGPRDIEPIVDRIGISQDVKPNLQPLLNMRAIRRGDGPIADVWYQSGNGSSDTPRLVGTIEYLGPEENTLYCNDSFRLQRLFNFLAKVPDAKGLGKKLLRLDGDEWSWKGIGKLIADHLQKHVSRDTFERWRHDLAQEMHLSSPKAFPEPIKQNPYYFCYFLAGGILAKKLIEEGVFKSGRTTAEIIDDVSTISRRHLFHFGLYKVEPCNAPIAV